MISNRRLPMLSIAGNVTMNVMIVPLSVRFPLKKKRRREILNDLIIVICGPKLYPVDS